MSKEPMLGRIVVMEVTCLIALENLFRSLRGSEFIRVIARSLGVCSSFRCNSWLAVASVLVNICLGSRVCRGCSYNETERTRDNILNSKVGSTLRAGISLCQAVDRLTTERKACRTAYMT